MDNFLIKQYYYCCDHDDAYFMVASWKEVSSSMLFIERQCCLSKRICDLKHIGRRIYVDNKMIEDTTPSDEWFDRQGGGYLKEYLDEASVIDS